MVLPAGNPDRPQRRTTLLTKHRVVGNPTDRSDPWALVNSADYSENTFYVGYHGNRGSADSKQHNIRTSNAMDAAIRELIDKGQVPYKTVDDFYRDAAAHRAKFVKDQLDDPNSKMEFVVDTTLIESFMNRVEAMREMRRNVMAHAMATIQQLHRTKEMDDLREALEHAGLLADQWHAYKEGGELRDFLVQYEHLQRRAAMKSVD